MEKRCEEFHIIILKPDQIAGRLKDGKAKSLLGEGDTTMSKMPTDRTSAWNGIFQRFGALDGGRHQKPALETERIERGTDTNLRNGHHQGSRPQTPPLGRNVRK